MYPPSLRKPNNFVRRWSGMIDVIHSAIDGDVCICKLWTDLEQGIISGCTLVQPGYDRHSQISFRWLYRWISTQTEFLNSFPETVSIRIQKLCMGNGIPYSFHFILFSVYIHTGWSSLERNRSSIWLVLWRFRHAGLIAGNCSVHTGY
jgi:hypothetical protein